MLTLDDLKAICPRTPSAKLEPFVEPLNATFEEFEINNVARECAFLAQAAHESAGFTALSENLNYSAEGLLRVFPRYFDGASATDYARRPERIANRVYANRMGNGDEASGDGWRNRGAGIFQITGEENHGRISEHFSIARESVGDWLRTPEGACRSAGLFWRDNGLNELADAGDFRKITKRINGGYNGWTDRVDYLERAQNALG